MLKSPSLRVLLALVAGLGLGMALAAFESPALSFALPLADVVGTLWTNAIRMTVIPLVAALTVASVASTGGSAELRTAGLRALLVFVVLLLAGGVLAFVIGRASFAGFTLAPEVADRLRGSVAAVTSAPAVPSLAQRIIEMVPSNPIKSAVDGALLPLVVFALALGFALKQVTPDRRAPVVDACRGVADAMLVVVGWVVAAAPVGVFGLTVALGARLGVASIGKLAHYIATLSIVLSVFTLLLYPVVVLLGRMPFRRFLAAAAPAQALAAGSRSSLAALPVMISAAREKLGLGEAASGFVLPLAVSMFKFAAPVSWTFGSLFVAWFYGIELHAAQYLTLAFATIFFGFASPGVPRGAFLMLAPLFAAIGLPVEGIGILIAVDGMPDLFATVTNSTGYLAATALVARFS